MWKTLVPAVLLWPVLGAAAGSAEGGENRPGGCFIDRPDKGILIDIQGKLQENFVCGTPAPGGKEMLHWQWQITAKGKTYELDLGDVRAWYRIAQRHNGKTVRIKGRLEFRGRPESLLQLAKDPAPVFGAWIIVVTDMQPVVEHHVRETVEFEVHGKLQFNQKLGLPERVVNIITAGKQKFVLEMSRYQARLAYKWDGQNVVVKGRMTGRFIEMEWSCLPPEWETVFPILQVTHIAPAPGSSVQKTVHLDVQGVVGPIGRKPSQVWNDDELPNWKITAGDKTYELEVGPFGPLLETVKALNGKTVKITGRVEGRTYALTRRSNGQPVLMDACCVMKSVLVVEHIEVVDLEHIGVSVVN
jgi:hypothetical protein